MVDGGIGMLTVVQRMDIHDLQSQGHSIRAIERLTGYSRNTIRKVLRGEHNRAFATPDRGSKLDPYKDYLRKRFAEVELSAVRLLEEIKPMGYAGSLQTLRRFMRELKAHKRVAEKTTVRFETAAGHQAQVDWGYCGKFEDSDGKKISVYVFAMVLSYSRMLYIEFTNSMQMPHLLACHEHAFAAFGGIPKQILYDNMKQVRTSRMKLNEQMVDFADHYGLSVKTHKPYRPRTKGKVERLMTYVKDNFLKGREFEGMDHLNAAGQHWLAETANVRLHATIEERPIDVFERDERGALHPMSDVRPYPFGDPKNRIVSYDGMVNLNGSHYSVPPTYVGQQVNVFAQAGQIIIRSDDLIIAEHQQAVRSGQCVTDPDHIVDLWKTVAQQIEVPDHSRDPNWRMKFESQVASTALTTYEAVLT